MNGGTFNMSGGTIVGNKNNRNNWSVGAVWIESGEFHMSGDAAIKGCNGREGAVETGENNDSKTSTVTMSGNALIENCTAWSCGGAMFLRKNATFTMTGGTIKDCVAKVHSGGIDAKAATAKLLGGQIINNRATDGDNGLLCGGVRSEADNNGNRGTIILGGHIQITGNTAVGAVKNLYVNGGETITISTETPPHLRHEGRRDHQDRTDDGNQASLCGCQYQ